jgi:hypothetical protein
MPVGTLLQNERLLGVRELCGFYRLPLLPAREIIAENSSSERSSYRGSEQSGKSTQWPKPVRTLASLRKVIGPSVPWVLIAQKFRFGIFYRAQFGA